MADYYILNDDHSVTPIIEAMDWARAYEDCDKRRVARTELGAGAWVSTVFLGLNHSFSQSDEPLIFETMVFQGDMSDKLCWRYSTWDQAEIGHDKAVALVQRFQSEGRSLDDLWCEEQPV